MTFFAQIMYVFARTIQAAGRAVVAARRHPEAAVSAAARNFVAPEAATTAAAQTSTSHILCFGRRQPATSVRNIFAFGRSEASAADRSFVSVVPADKTDEAAAAQSGFPLAVFLHLKKFIHDKDDVNCTEVKLGFRCTDCSSKKRKPQLFTSRYQLKRHMARKHRNFTYHCRLCDEMFSTEDKLEMHKKNACPLKGFSDFPTWYEAMKSVKAAIKADKAAMEATDNQVKKPHFQNYGNWIQYIENRSF